MHDVGVRPGEVVLVGELALVAGAPRGGRTRGGALQQRACEQVPERQGGRTGLSARRVRSSSTCVAPWASGVRNGSVSAERGVEVAARRPARRVARRGSAGASRRAGRRATTRRRARGRTGPPRLRSPRRWPSGAAGSSPPDRRPVHRHDVAVEVVDHPPHVDQGPAQREPRDTGHAVHHARPVPGRDAAVGRAGHEPGPVDRARARPVDRVERRRSPASASPAPCRRTTSPGSRRPRRRARHGRGRRDRHAHDGPGGSRRRVHSPIFTHRAPIGSLIRALPQSTASARVAPRARRRATCPCGTGRADRAVGVAVRHGLPCAARRRRAVPAGRRVADPADASDPARRLSVAAVAAYVALGPVPGVLAADEPGRVGGDPRAPDRLDPRPDDRPADARAAGGRRCGRSSCRTWLMITAASVLITVNWGVYIWAANHGRVVDSALGYYIHPLFSCCSASSCSASGCAPGSGSRSGRHGRGRGARRGDRDVALGRAGAGGQLRASTA